MGPSEQLQHYLDEKHASYELHHHASSMTALELAESEHVDPHEIAKVIVLKDDKHHYMMVIPADYELDLHATREFLNSPHAALATEAELERLFPDCETGAMPPFGMLYKVPVFAESDMDQIDHIEFNAGSHKEAIRMDYGTWKNLVHPSMGHFAHKMH